MTKQTQLLFSTSILATVLPFNAATAGHSIDVEAAMVFTGYSDVAISDELPADKFSFTDDLSSEPFVAGRVRYEFTKDKHWVGALVAPLTVRPTGSFDRDIVFKDTLYPAGSDIDALYKFNSYRLAYRYLVKDTPKHQLRVGAALKVRDAEISLGKSAMSNVGVVPLLSMNYTYKTDDKLNFVIDGEALGAKQGRAADVFFGTTYKVHDKVKLKAGYRVLEGGADNDEVYNFALFNYATLGVVVEF